VLLNLLFLGEWGEASREIKDLIATWIGRRSCLPGTGVCQLNLLSQTFGGERRSGLSATAGGYFSEDHIGDCGTHVAGVGLGSEYPRSYGGT
jgi:hypothetical protein